MLSIRGGALLILRSTVSFILFSLLRVNCITKFLNAALNTSEGIATQNSRKYCSCCGFLQWFYSTQIIRIPTTNFIFRRYWNRVTEDNRFCIQRSGVYTSHFLAFLLRSIGFVKREEKIIHQRTISQFVSLVISNRFVLMNNRQWKFVGAFFKQISLESVIVYILKV